MLDPKPALERHDGKRFPGVIDAMNADKAGAVMRSPFRFARYGKSGIDVSDLLPYLARVVDKITVVSTGGETSGVNKVTADMAQMVAQVPALLESLTGKQMSQLLEHVRKLRLGNGASPEVKAEGNVNASASSGELPGVVKRK